MPASKAPPSAETTSIASSARTLINSPSNTQEFPANNDPSNHSSTITLPIPLSELLSPKEIARLDAYRGQCNQFFWITRLINRNKEKRQSARGETAGSKERVKDVRMSWGEYEAYWARDDGGNYAGTEPEGKGREIVRERLWAELGLFGKSARTGKSERDRYVCRGS